jgi:hypothetical protein
MWHVWGKERNVYRFLVGNTEVKRSLGRCGHRWDNNITTNYKTWRGKCGLD